MTDPRHLRLVEKSPWNRAESFERERPDLYDSLAVTMSRRNNPSPDTGARKSGTAPDLYTSLAEQEDVRGDLRIIARGAAAALWSVLIFLVARAV